MLLFRSEGHVDRWCAEQGHPRGALVTLSQLWRLAVAWYSDRLSPSWRRKSPAEAEAVFTELGLTDGFWRLSG